MAGYNCIRDVRELEQVPALQTWSILQGTLSNPREPSRSNRGENIIFLSAVVFALHSVSSIMH